MLCDVRFRKVRWGLLRGGGEGEEEEERRERDMYFSAHFKDEKNAFRDKDMNR